MCEKTKKNHDDAISSHFGGNEFLVSDFTHLFFRLPLYSAVYNTARLQPVADKAAGGDCEKWVLVMRPTYHNPF